MKKISNQISHLSPIKLAYAIEQLKSKVKIIDAEPIAIIGVGCRFPGNANDPETFWRLMMDGIDATSEIPENRWNIEDWYDSDPDVSGKMYSRHGSFIDSVEYFDANFFGLSKKEVLNMDPQQRLVLEVAWEALENGNHAPDSLYGSDAGVFLGICTYDHAIVKSKTNFKHTVDAYYASGNLLNVASGRLSFALGLTGPALSVDTACSSSLVAVHLACQSLRKRECSLAITGGVGLLLSPEMHMNFCKARMISPDGKCKTFDAAANGYVRGEGCGMIILKRLTDAISNKDNILAIIRGSAVNQDGASGGLTVPNGPSQEKLIQNALESAGVKTDQVGYIEAHGTGTSLGDPIELGALGNVFCKEKRKNPLVVGSVKTNIGHLEAAAGIAGIIKTALILKHKIIPPHLHFIEPNPRIPWDELHIAIPTSQQQLIPFDNRFIAGVSSFGFSGINAHVVLEAHTAKAPASNIEQKNTEHHLLTISAKTTPAIKETIHKYIHFISQQTDTDLQDICYTANTCRSHFNKRFALVTSSKKDLLDQLKEINHSNDLNRIEDTEDPCIVFLFTGQGAQYLEMGKELFETQPVFKMVLEECDKILRDYLEIPLLELLFSDIYKNNETSPLHNTAYTQPALFAFEYALAALWKSWGIEPDIVMGHSVGEYTAACLSGVFSLEDGLKLIAARGRLMQALPLDGEMWAVFTTENNIIDATVPYQEDISIAAYNGPEIIVISGKKEAMQSILSDLKSKGFRATKLNVSHAFHSPLMEPMLESFAQVANDITYHAPQIKLVSNVTGNFTVDISNPDYWVKHIRQPVRFFQSMNTICNEQTKTFLIEIGPKPILIGMSLRFIPENPKFVWLPSMRPVISETKQMLISLSELYKGGISVNWSGVYQEKYFNKIQLPLYSFQRKKYWNIKSNISEVENMPHPLIDQKVESPLVKEIIFQSKVSVSSPGCLKDHIIYEQVVVPAAYYLSMLLGASELMNFSNGCQLKNLVFPTALVLSNKASKNVQIVANPEGKNEYSVKLISVDNDLNESMMLHADGKLVHHSMTVSSQLYVDEIKERCLNTFSGDILYQTMKQFALDFGPGFQWVKSIWKSHNEVLCLLEVPEVINQEEVYQIHPGLIDAFLQPFFLGAPLSDNNAYVPFRIDQFNYFQPYNNNGKLWSHTIFRNEMIQNEKMVIDSRLFNESCELIAEVIGIELKKITQSTLLKYLTTSNDPWVYSTSWIEKELKVDQPLISKRSKQWFILTDSIHQDLSEKIVQKLKNIGHQCYVGTFDDKTEYRIQSGSKAEFSSMFSKIGPIDGILFCPGLDETSQNFHNCDSGTFRLDLILHLVQAIISEKWQMMPQLFILTKQSQAVEILSVVNIKQSPLWGFVQVLHQEYPSFRCVCIDLDKKNNEKEVELIVQEMISPESNEYKIAYRNKKRYCERLSTNQFNVEDDNFIKNNASYLITGGTGSLGFQACQWLITQGARFIILTARKAPGSALQRKIKNIEKKGIQILFIESDISIKSSTQKVFIKAKESMPEIAGIIHTAGVLDDAMLLNQSIEKFDKVLKPKTSGAWNLHVFSQDLNLDFMVFFSSAVSIIGSAGQSNYAAANSFMDTLAHFRHSLGLPALSVNWGPWEGSSMIDHLNTIHKKQWTDRGLSYIDYYKGFEILKKLISNQSIQACVMPVQWSRFLWHYPDNKTPHFFDNFIETSSKIISEPSIFIEQLNDLDINEKKKLLQTHIQNAISTLLDLDDNEKIGLSERFFDVGIDSIMAVTLTNQLEDDLGHSLVPTLMLDYPTIESMVHYIMEDVLLLDLDESNKKLETMTYDTKIQNEDLNDLSEDELANLLLKELE